MNQLKELISFLGLTSVIFIGVFALMNFSALKEIVTPYVFAEEARKQELILEKSVDKQEKKQTLFVPKGAKKLVKNQYPTFDTAVAPIDSRIVIPKLGINAPINEMSTETLKVQKWSDFEDKIQTELKTGVVHYPGTAKAGEIGNMFITGHSSYYPWDNGKYKDVFARLHKLNVGDEYYVFQGQKKYTYKITEKKEVSPSNVSVLEQPNDKKISTLMTCTPLGTSLRRLIITSELVSGIGRI